MKSGEENYLGFFGKNNNSKDDNMSPRWDPFEIAWVSPHPKFIIVDICSTTPILILFRIQPHDL